MHALSRRALIGLSAGLVVLGPAVRGAIAAFFNDGRPAYDVGDAVYWFTASHADAFAAGALVALLRLGERVTRPALVAAVAAGVVAVAGAVNLSALRSSGADLPLGTLGFPLASIANRFHLWGYTVLNLAAAALVAAAVGAHRRGGILAGLGWGPLAGLGKISYGVYVLHWPLLVLFNASVRYRPMTHARRPDVRGVVRPRRGRGLGELALLRGAVAGPEGPGPGTRARTGARRRSRIRSGFTIRRRS